MSPDVVPILPSYSGACTANVVPELVKHAIGQPMAGWMPPSLHGARQVVLLVLDGLGWDQLSKRRNLVPSLAGFTGMAITTVAPTTTVTAITSIVTGRPPSIHGMLGYSVIDEGSVFNLLLWCRPDGVGNIPDPLEYQLHPAFAANEVPAVIPTRFIGSGFTNAYMQGVRITGYPVASSLPVEIWRLVRAGESFVYAYYGGVDAVAHAHGFGEHYDAELYTVDRLIRDLLAGFPSGTALVVTSDHGQVEVAGPPIVIDPDIVDMVSVASGEGRFRWLRAHEGQADDLLQACRERYGDRAWVHSRAEIDKLGWFGSALSERYRQRVGDVAIAPFEPVSFANPKLADQHNMVCQHGSLTSEEMLVPLLAIQA